MQIKREKSPRRAINLNLGLCPSAAITAHGGEDWVWMAMSNVFVSRHIEPILMDAAKRYC